MAPPTPQPQRPDYDQALKRLLTRAHDGFLALIAPDLTWRDERNVEVAQAARRADLVWEVTHPDGQRGILHIELQTKAEPDIGERLADYLIGLYRRDHLPIRSVVVFLRQVRTVPSSPFVIPWGVATSLRLDFNVIRLWEIEPEQVLSTPNYALWPLTSLMAQATTESVLAVAERLAAAPLTHEERRDLTGLLLTLSGVNLPAREIYEAMRRHPVIDDLLKESSVGQALIEQGKAEGIEQGKAEGIEQGKAEGERRMAQQALEGRFGALSADVLAALNAADEAALLALVAHITTDTPEQMRARLGLS